MKRFTIFFVATFFYSLLSSRFYLRGNLPFLFCGHMAFNFRIK